MTTSGLATRWKRSGASDMPLYLRASPVCVRDLFHGTTFCDRTIAI
jgi:hypothetical protein